MGPFKLADGYTTLVLAVRILDGLASGLPVVTSSACEALNTCRNPIVPRYVLLRSPDAMCRLSYVLVHPDGLPFTKEAWPWPYVSFPYGANSHFPFFIAKIDP